LTKRSTNEQAESNLEGKYLGPWKGTGGGHL